MNLGNWMFPFFQASLSSLMWANFAAVGGAFALGVAAFCTMMFLASLVFSAVRALAALS